MTKPKPGRDPATLRYVARQLRISARRHAARQKLTTHWNEIYARGQCYAVLSCEGRRFEREARAKKGK